MVTVDNTRIPDSRAATSIIAEGEVRKLINSGNQIDETTYRDVIQRKTAKLFEAAARLGACWVARAPPLEDALARYGSLIWAPRSS
jgi:octaprenyl-diphosphate synthase